MSDKNELDLVCGMTVNPEGAAGKFEHEGKTYYFCSQHCLHKFSANPENYINKKSFEPMPQTQLVGLSPRKKTLPVMMHEHHEHHHSAASEIDPVCGMAVNPETAAGQFEYKGKTYYFCNPHCLNKFQSNPESYLNKKTQTEEDLRNGT
jgi:Cu+-exporting ATPase